MKTLLTLTLLSISSAYANECPNIQGTYHCVFEDGSYSKLKVTQEQTSETITTYGFEYVALNLGADYVPASIYGETDDMGWITKCKNGRLMSIPGYGGNMLSEIYLDREGAFTRASNGTVAQRCPKGNSK